MKSYLLRRFLYTLPVALGVYIITFSLFHLRDPMAIARVNLPQGNDQALQQWIHNHGYHLPRFVNLPSDAQTIAADGQLHPEFAERSLFYSRFFLGLGKLAMLDLGYDRNGRAVSSELSRRIPVSLSIMVPSFLLTAGISLFVSVLSAWRSGQFVDRLSTLISILALSVALPVWLLGTTFFFGKLLPVFPIYNSVLPAIFVAVLAGLGGQIRFYRTIF
ncbi:MAG: hypothetical protein KDK33_20155, partial [Leptospiraceae bacterium]|nr:hypothetical protein [Leptospiraceae bacterium]